MKTYILTALALLLTNLSFTQVDDSSNSYMQNSAERLLSSDNKLMLGGYGEVHYNQPLNSGTRNNGSLDVHRVVMMLGYNFNSKTRFITEFEFEHISEVVVEQAFLQYSFTGALNIRAGLMLIPMGITNEYHEPTTFNGVERPVIDNRIAPTTWREIGIGITGNMIGASLKYQLYLVNGFNGYDDGALLTGRNLFRNGRQKGAESFISTPNITGKIEYYGFKGLNVGLSGYFGNTQSRLYNGMDKDDKSSIVRADSSVAGIAMTGLDARYRTGGLQFRGQFYYAAVSNTDKYNRFTETDGTPNDLGSSAIGYFVEAGYDVVRFIEGTETVLILFGRFEKCNTHNSTSGELVKNKAFNNQIITTGLTLKLTNGAVVKADIQFLNSEAEKSYSTAFNAGIGVMF